jgi:hypothetical protein
LVGYSIELCLFLFSPDPVAKVSENILSGADFACSVLLGNAKIPRLLSILRSWELDVGR